MADAGPCREAGDLYKPIPRVDQEGWRSVCAVRSLEGYVLRSIHPLGSRRLRSVFRSIRSDGPPRPNNHPDGAEAGLLFSVAVRVAFALASFVGDARASHWTSNRNHRTDPSSISVR